MPGSNRLEVLITANTKQFSDRIRSVERETDDMVGALAGKAQGASLAFGALAAAGGVALSGFIDKASEMQTFQATLEALTGSVDQAQADLAKFSAFAASTPFEIPGVVQAGIAFKSAGLEVDRFLPLAGNLAALMHRDVGEAAGFMARALRGNAEALHIITDSGLVTKDRLVELGAVLKADGSIAMEAGKGLEALQNALSQAVAEKGDVMGKQAKTIAGAVSTLSDTIGQIKADLGNQEADLFNGIVLSLTDLLNGFRELGPVAKSVIADTVVVGTVLAGIASIVTGLASVLGPAYLAWTIYGERVAAATEIQAESKLVQEATTAATIEQTGATQAAAVAQGELAAAEEITVAVTEQVAVAAGEAAVAETGMAAASTGLSGALTSTAASAGAAARGVAAFLGPIGIAAVAATTLGIGLNALIKSYNEAYKAQDKLTKKQAESLVAYHKEAGLARVVTDAVREYGDASELAAQQIAKRATAMGKDDADLAAVQAGNMQKLAQAEADLAAAREKGNFGDAKVIQARVDALNKEIETNRMARRMTSGMHAEREKQAADAVATEKRVGATREKLLADYKAKASAGYYETEKAQLAALDSVLHAIGKNHKEYGELALGRVKLARQVSQDEKKAATDAQGAQFRAEQHKISLIDDTDRKGMEAKLARLKQLQSNQNLTIEQRQNLESAVAQTEQQLARKTSEERKKAEADADKASKAAEAERKRRAAEQKRVEKENADAALKRAEAEVKGAEESVSAAQEAFREGKGTAAQLIEQVQLREKLTAALNLQKATQEGLGKSQTAKHDLRAAAEAENAAAAKKTEREIANIRDESTKRDQQRAAEKAQRAEEAAKQEEEQLRARGQAGENVETSLKAAVQARQKAERDSLQQKTQAALVGASQADAEKVIADYQKAAYEMAVRQKGEQAAITAELEKQKQAAADKSALNLNGGSYGIDSFFDSQQMDDTIRKPAGLSGSASPSAGGSVAGNQAEAERKAEGAVADLGKTGTPETLAAISQTLASINQKMDKPVVAKVQNAGGALSTDSRNWNDTCFRGQGQY